LSTTSKQRRLSDPFRARELKAYENPLPSREYIISTLEQEDVPVDIARLESLLAIEPHEVAVFSHRIRAMERDGQLLRNRKNSLCLPKKIDLIQAHVEGHADGFGFAVPLDGSGDLYLSPREMRGVIHGDRVLVRPLVSYERGKREGVVVELLERVNQTLVAKLASASGGFKAIADNYRISQDFWVSESDSLGAQAGQIVVVELIPQPNKRAQPNAKVIKILGDYADSGMEIEIALRNHHLPHEFQDNVLQEIKGLSEEDIPQLEDQREDLTALSLVTIDGETAKDFDDAVYAEPIKGTDHYRLIVAIADVSYYVKPATNLDKEALNRGTSVYFPRRVIPMLPEILSNGLCSLKPQVNRYAVVCDMVVDSVGQIAHYRFYNGLIKSHARLTYTQVQNYLDSPHKNQQHELSPLSTTLDTLYLVYGRLLTQRHQRGAIDFGGNEVTMTFDATGKIESVVPVVRLQSHRLIEECMLAANVCAAEYLAANSMPLLYRNHAKPSVEKIEVLRQFLSTMGLPLSGGDKPHAKDYAAVIEKIQNRPDRIMIETVLLRSLQQARYSPVNEGHFGLAYDAYAHFTSPIRRYPDLLVHRSLKAVFEKKSPPSGDWVVLGQHCSLTERRADDASHDVEQWLKCYFMKDRIGEAFKGTISSVTSFGLFVTLSEVYVDGLVHISELANDYYQFDAKNHQLVGEHSHERFQLCDSVEVVVVRVDMDSRRIELNLKSHDKKTSKGKIRKS
jgi:ribonuclease R